MSAWNGVYEDDAIPCPRCQGDGSVDCHCGGDLCVCENYGERDCPTCYGEGEVSQDRHARYRESERLAHEAMQRVWAEAAAEASPPTETSQPGTPEGVNQTILPQTEKGS